MYKLNAHLSIFSAFRIVVFYAIFSAIYIYSSDYFLETFIKDVELLTRFQTYKGIGFIIITAALLYILVKRNLDTTTSYFQQIIDVKQQSDEQIKASQQEYMTLFNHSPLPMLLFEIPSLNILLVNEACCDFYGYTMEEFSRMNLSEIRPAEDVPLMHKNLTESFNSENHVLPSVIRHIKKSGEIIYVKVKNTSVIYQGKTVKIASAVDLSSEIEAQMQLQESNTKLKIASEIANLGYWTNDIIKNKIHWSDELYKIFELDPATFELTLENVISHFHPENQQQFKKELGEDASGNSINESEQRIITGTGKIKWILERVYITKDENGIPLKIDGIALDITNRKLHEQEIEKSNERFETLAKATIEAIIDWDIVNDKVIWGEGFHSLLGYDLSQYDNYLWSSNIHPDDRERVLGDLNKTLEDPTKETFNAEFRFLKANRDVAYMQHRGIFIRDENGKAIRALGAMIDLSEALEHLQKIEAQDKALKQIAWTQSHVVRAPLANLMGLVSLLNNSNANGSYDQSLINHINDSAEKLDLIIHEIVNKSSENDHLS